MHTTGLRSHDFAITVAGETATLHDVFPGFTARDRLGIVIHEHLGAAGAGSLILAAVTAFYDHLRAGGEPFFAYADYFAFHVGSDHGSLRKLDVWPPHKEVVVPNEAETILEAINDRAVTRLLVPEPQAAATAAAARTEPDLHRETRHSAQRLIRSALVYSPTGHAADGDVLVRGSAQSDSYIHAMLGSPEGEADEPRPAQNLRRTDPHQALGLLLATGG